MEPKFKPNDEVYIHDLKHYYSNYFRAAEVHGYDSREYRDRKFKQSEHAVGLVLTVVGSYITERGEVAVLVEARTMQPRVHCGVFNQKGLKLINQPVMYNTADDEILLI